jgi:hypothetical protein
MINEVRNTVLSILNKNNYGYISPSDFNLFASQAQMELFEEMFSDYNATINKENVRLSGTDYGDQKKIIEEAMELFNSTRPLSNLAGSVYFLPSLVTTGNDYYMLVKVLCYPTILDTGSNTSVTSFYLVNSAATFLSDGIVPGDVVVNLNTNNIAMVAQVLSNTTLILDSNIFTTTPVDYVVLKSSDVVEAEKVTHSRISLLNTSTLTPSSQLFPSYTQQTDVLTVFPVSYKNRGQVVANYFRYPATPKWTYITLVSGEPAFDQSQPDYQDFEIPQEYEYPLIFKILQYAGMSIREIEAVQFGAVQEAQQNENKK